MTRGADPVSDDTSQASGCLSAIAFVAAMLGSALLYLCLGGLCA